MVASGRCSWMLGGGQRTKIPWGVNIRSNFRFMNQKSLLPEPEIAPLPPPPLPISPNSTPHPHPFQAYPSLYPTRFSLSPNAPPPRSGRKHPRGHASFRDVTTRTSIIDDQRSGGTDKNIGPGPTDQINGTCVPPPEAPIAVPSPSPSMLPAPESGRSSEVFRNNALPRSMTSCG